MNTYRIVIVSAEVVRESYINADRYQTTTSEQGMTTITFTRDGLIAAEFFVANCMSAVVVLIKRPCAADTDE